MAKFDLMSMHKKVLPTLQFEHVHNLFTFAKKSLNAKLTCCIRFFLSFFFLSCLVVFFLSCNMFLLFVGLTYQGKDIVFRFIIEYSSLKDFGP